MWRSSSVSWLPQWLYLQCSEWQRSVSVSIFIINTGNACTNTLSFNEEISKSNYRRGISNIYISIFFEEVFSHAFMIVARALLVFNLIFYFHFNTSFSRFYEILSFYFKVILNVSMLEFYLSHFSISTSSYIILVFSSLLFFFYIYNLNP